MGNLNSSMVGTRIKIVVDNHTAPYGELGTIVEPSRYAFGSELTVRFDTFDTHELYFVKPDEAVELPASGPFKVGDRVYSNHVTTPDWTGAATVTHTQKDSRYTYIQLDSGPNAGIEGAIRHDLLEPLSERRLTVYAPRDSATIRGATNDRIMVEGDFTFKIEDIQDVAYVQVDYSPSTTACAGYLYTYIDPSGDLKVGDLVEVPVSYGTKVGRVRELGRGSWNGECKAVVARLTREAL